MTPRLTEVRSNGVLVASNYYDHLGRRVRLVASEASYTFIYDGWNVVLELVDHDGVSERIEYYWGKDISGSLQGAGGVWGASLSEAQRHDLRPDLRRLRQCDGISHRRRGACGRVCL